MGIRVLVLIFILTVCSTLQQNCQSQWAKYERVGPYCMHSISRTSPMNIYEQCKYCFFQNAHMMTLKQLLELRPYLSVDRYLPLRSNYLLTGPDREPLHDEGYGFIDASTVGELDFPQPKMGMFISVNPKSLRALSADEVGEMTGYCVKRDKRKSKNIMHFIIGFEGQEKTYHSNEQGKLFSRQIDASSKLICLVKCMTNEWCAAAYFSESKRHCSHRMYMDTFLHEDDKAIAEDFQRYALYR